jgi:hypothetical protein
MSGLEARDFSAPDETRTPDKTTVELVNLGGGQIGLNPAPAVAEMDELHDLASLMRSHPRYAAPESTRNAVRTIVASGRYNVLDSAVVLDDDLMELELAADPEGPLDEDAAPWNCSPDVNAGLLPQWYMPAPSAGGPRIRGWRRAVILSVVVALLLIAASGLCSTYGRIVLA